MEMVIGRPGGDERLMGCSIHVEKNWTKNKTKKEYMHSR